MIISFVLPAQTQLKGKVVDESGTSLPGVNIILKGSNQGTVTDADGSFTMGNVSSSSVLVFSFIGFVTQEITVGEQSALTITMITDVRALEEVVVVGYGTQKKGLITGAIASVKTDEIGQTPVLRVEQALQGRIPGIVVTNQSGQPGDAPTVRIRGAGTNGNADPLYVVDGFPVGGIDFLNPSDIETMSVLKDAASSAIYGARGANGVVLITTKKGTRKALAVNYEGYVGVQNPWKKVSVLDNREYMIMMNEGAANAGNTMPYADVNAETHNTDWQDELFNKNAPISNQQLSFSGGSDNSMYNSSISYFTQEGIVGGDKSQFDRYSFRLNSEHKAGERFTVGTNLVYTQIQRKSINSNQEFGGLLNNAINLDPLTPLYETDPALLANYNVNAVRNAAGEYYGISTRVAQEIVNPLARLEITHGETKVDKVVGNLSGELKIVEGLKYKIQGGVDAAFVTTDGYTPIFYLNSAQSNTQSTVNKSISRYFNWQLENILSYEKTLNDQHFITAMVGTTALENNFEDLSGSKAGLLTTNPDNAFINMANDETSMKSGGGAYQSSLLSFFGRANYSFDERYLFTATIRRDGSSKFGANNKYATFPSFSAGWVLSEEGFLSDLAVVNYAKLRASWGQNGSESALGAYPWAATIGTGFGYTLDNTFISGSIPAQVSNPDIRWETSEQTDIGLDLQLLDNKINFTFDYYIKTTKDQIINKTIPGTVGSNSNIQPVNGGTVQNRGIELSLAYNDNIGDLSYSASANIAFNNNEVTSTSGGAPIQGASYSTYGVISRYEEGFPVAYFWGYKTDGIFQNQAEVDAHTNSDGTLLQPNAQPGDVRFVDRDNNGTIDDKDRTMIGNPTPKATYGVNLSANYKGFDFSFFLQGVYGNDIFNGLKRHDLTSSNMPAYFLGRWTGEGSTNELPRFSWSDPNGNWTRVSDLYIENGAYARIKNLQIGYTLPLKQWNVPVNKARIYVAFDNLVTFTKYRGYDPEIGARSALDIGVDRGIYPQPRTYRMGLNVTF